MFWIIQIFFCEMVSPEGYMSVDKILLPHMPYNCCPSVEILNALGGIRYPALLFTTTHHLYNLPHQQHHPL